MKNFVEQMVQCTATGEHEICKIYRISHDPISMQQTGICTFPISEHFGIGMTVVKWAHENVWHTTGCAPKDFYPQKELMPN